jgi:alkaline phosphatase D
MPARAIDVEWEVADDERFTRVAQRGVTTAATELAHSVHVELTGLRPGAEYFYRFRSGGHVSPVGRTRTTPTPGTVAPMTMCFASCSDYEQGWFTGYRRLADEHPDLVVHLGDYQYEYSAKQTGGVRRHIGGETVTLAGYRRRYAQYKSDADLQAAHAAAPWLTVFDDHEIADNWAAAVPSEPQPGFRERLASALRAYYENMPLRRRSMPTGPDMRLYRRAHWGDLVTFHMLDTRQYRDNQACGDEIRDCPERFRSSPHADRRCAGTRLLNGFARSRARWDVLGQQVFFSQVDLTPGPERGVNPGPIRVTTPRHCWRRTHTSVLRLAPRRARAHRGVLRHRRPGAGVALDVRTSARNADNPWGCASYRPSASRGR